MDEGKLLYSEILNDLVAGTLVLPTLPAIALKVRGIVDDPDVSAAALSDVIMTDPALSARLIRAVNSALYRGTSSIDNIQLAVTRLGRNTIKNIVTTLVMKEMFVSPDQILDTHLEVLWESSTQVGAASQVLASEIKGLNNDDAMFAGLIHNIGSLPILIAALSRPELLSNTEAMLSVMSRLSPRIGEAIAISWGFSDAIVDAVAAHAELDSSAPDGGPNLTDVVRVAYLQSLLNTGKAISTEGLQQVASFKKMGLDPFVKMVEQEENREAYAEALSIFNV